MKHLNLFDAELQVDDDDPPGYHTAYLRTAAVLGGNELALNVFELGAGQSLCPYHYEHGEEEWIVVLSGTATVRTPDGERELREWDCMYCPAGEEGAHKVMNPSAEPARVLIWSNHLAVASTVYPDSGKVGAWPPGKLFRLAEAVSYWDGEAEAPASD